MNAALWPDGPAAGRAVGRRVLVTAEGDGLGFDGQGHWRY